MRIYGVPEISIMLKLDLDHVGINSFMIHVPGFWVLNWEGIYLKMSS